MRDRGWEILAQADRTVGEDPARFLPRRRIVRGHACAFGEQPAYDGDRGRPPHIASFGPEREPEDSNPHASERGEILAHQGDYLVRLLLVHLGHRSQEHHRLAEPFSMGDERCPVLWQTASAEATPN